MTSAPVRDPLADHLLTPENAAFLFIDYQPSQLATIRSMDPALLLKNAVSTVRTIKTFGVPVVHSTVNVANGQGPTLPELASLLADDKPLDRTTVNSWEDIEFVQAVHATGRRKLIICALWTEVCMAFTAARRVRGLPGRRRDRRHFTRGPPGRPGPRDPSRRAADQLGLARLRAAARLGPPGNSRGGCRDRPHRPPAEGVTAPRSTRRKSG
jgi:Isochorismatase family